MSDQGLASEWTDKMHRLVYDLVAECVRLARALESRTGRAEQAEADVARLRKALERTTAMCRAATTWSPDDSQGLRYRALEAAKEGMAALAAPASGREDGSQ